MNNTETFSSKLIHICNMHSAISTERRIYSLEDRCWNYYEYEALINSDDIEDINWNQIYFEEPGEEMQLGLEGFF